MNALIPLLFDASLGVLLVATILYCARLSRRIRLLQDSKGELAGMIGRFDAATERAMASLAELQTVSKRIADALHLKIEKANFLADDLAFLIEKSSKLVTQLEKARSPASAEASRAKPQLVKPHPAFASKPATEAASRAASLEAVLERLAASGQAAPSKAEAPSARTEAERELLAVLQSGGKK